MNRLTLDEIVYSHQGFCQALSDPENHPDSCNCHLSAHQVNDHDDYFDLGSGVVALEAVAQPVIHHVSSDDL